jgi:hypothetical protein
MLSEFPAGVSELKLALTTKLYYLRLASTTPAQHKTVAGNNKKNK